LAVANYVEEHGHYPPAFLADENGKPMHSWRVLILPYIEERELYKQYKSDEPWDGPSNRKLASRMPRMFALHGEEQPGNETIGWNRATYASRTWISSFTARTASAAATRIRPW
jgi:hypothetical protein